MYFGSSFMNMANPVMDEELMAAIQGGNMGYAQHLLAKKKAAAGTGGYSGGTMYGGGTKNFDEFATPAPDAVASGAEMNPIAAARNKGQRGAAMRAMHSQGMGDRPEMIYPGKGINRGMMR